MPMNNDNTYNLTVTWGKFLFNYDTDGNLLPEPELRWGWKGTATIITNLTHSVVVPNGWTYSTPPQGTFYRVETVQYTWLDMQTAISALALFWLNPST